MKKLISLLLCGAIFLTGCTSNNVGTQNTSVTSSQPEIETLDTTVADPVSDITELNDIDIQYDSLEDEQLLSHIEDLVYDEAVKKLDDARYFVENVTAVYISKEYLEEVAYNSQSNIYFGYTLEELDDLFQGSKYIFTLSENGITTVQELSEIEDTDTEEILKNVAIGAGVILLCVTISVITDGLGLPAVSMIFAESAISGTELALFSAIIGGVAAGVVRGVETGDMDEALEAAALTGSEGFKWGAIAGSISGGTNEAIALKGATLNGLTMNEAALIQKQSGYPLDVIKEFKDMKQYNICKDAGLTSQMVNGQTALIRNIDLTYADEFGQTNLERMRLGYAAIDPATGQPYQLHHIGQKPDSTLAILTKEEHMQGGNNTIWHDLSKETEVHGAGNNWDAQREAFWKALAEILEG